jgi:hypothetical protein
MLVMATIVGLMVTASMTDKSEALRKSVVRTLTPVGLIGGAFSVIMF